MSLDANRLYELLPAVYRIRDAGQGEPLRALVALFAREFEAIEENLEQLYDDQFIETCADWVAPYIGDLIGYRPLHGATAAVASPRAEVANTIAYRRRKGTALMLEQLARDLTDWPAHAAEFFEQLATTQYMKHTRLHAPATAAVRDEAAMRRAGGAFNGVAHTAEVRRPENRSGRYNIANVGLFLWRLLPLSLSGVPLVPDPLDVGGTRFRLNPLGADLALFRTPQPGDAIDSLSSPMHVPAPLSVRGMAAAVRAGQAAEDDYGPGESLVFLREDAAGDWQPVPVAEITVCDLRDTPAGWNHQGGVPAGTIGVDPERGRVVLGTGVAAPLRASFNRGFARAIGGGEYQRTPAGEAHTAQHRIDGGAALQPDIDLLAASGGRLLIEDSLPYAETPTLRVAGVTAPGAPGIEVVIGAANGARPLIAATGPLVLDIGARGRLVLDGLVISGGALTLAAFADTEPREIVLRHCTLVPGLALTPAGEPRDAGAASLVVEHPFAKVTIESCIVGALQIATDAECSVADSIVDANAATSPAYEGPGGTPGAPLTMNECTVLGKLHAQSFEHVSNSLLVARRAAADAWPAAVWAERTQVGCVRFSWLPADSIAPRRHRCLPSTEQPRVAPQFNALRYADAAYMQLRLTTPAALLTGADDEGEIGVMHALQQPQRESNLRVRLDEYLRFGLHAGIFYVT
ncbi:MAG: hypothetical protein WC760_13700 [Bacteroidia bacterium]|jgi:hypothetical protein